MKILLLFSQNKARENMQLNQDSISVPLGIGYLASILEKDNHKVSILDFQLHDVTEESLISKITNEHFDFFGISTVTSAACFAYRIAGLLKKYCPSVPIALGGPHTMALKESVFKECPYIDFLILGEGEITAVELLNAIDNKGDLRKVQGISYIDNNTVVTTQQRKYIEDLDEIPFPAYHLFEVDRYKYSPFPGQFFKLPMLNIVSSRGCPFQCIFCDRGTMGNIFRFRSAENIIEEIEFLMRKYGIKEIRFHDDNFMVNRERVHKFCHLIIDKKLDILWRCSSRVDLVDRETLCLMRQTGFVSISYGIESGSERILKNIKKNITKDQIRIAVRWSKECGIETKAFFMMNLPGETIEDVEETIKFSKELPLDWASYQLSFPIPNTELREIVGRQYKVDYAKWDNWDTQMSNEIYFEQDKLPADYLRKAMQRAWRGFYLRPRILWNIFKRIRDFRTMKSYFEGFLLLIKFRVIK